MTRTKELEQELTAVRSELAALRAATASTPAQTAGLALEDSESLFRSLFEGSSVAITIRDVHQQKFIDCNVAALRLYRCSSREDLFDSTPDQLAPPFQHDGRPSLEALREIVQTALHEGFYRSEWLGRRKDGELFLAELRITTMTLHDGRRIMHTMLEDISEKKRLETAAKQRAERDLLLQEVSQGFVQDPITTAKHRATELLRQCFHIARVSIRRFPSLDDGCGALLGRMAGGRALRFDDVAALPSDIDAASRNAILDEASGAGALMLVPFDTHGWIALASTTPRAWSDDEARAACRVSEIMAVAEARSVAEAEMRASEDRYRRLVERSRDAIIVVRNDGRILFASPATVDIFGYSLEELATNDRLILEAATPEHAPVIKQRLSDLAFEGLTLGTWRRKDGRIVHTETISSPILDEAGNRIAVQAITRDVTERIIAEQWRERRATRDELLGATSRGFLNDELEPAIVATLERVASYFSAVLVVTERSEGVVQWPRAEEVDPGAVVGRPTMEASLGYGDRVFGAIRIHGTEGQTWTAEDQRTLGIVGELIGIGHVRRAAELALAKAREDAIAASATKSAFLANMSHELRTPLNGVIGMVELLGTTTLDDRQKRWLDVARASARHLLAVITDILDFSKIEAGKVSLELEELTLNEVIEEVTNVLAVSAEEKRLELTVHSSEALVMPLVGDAGRLRQVLMNLLGNAVKFTRAGTVSVAATLADDTATSARLRVEVRDTGIGIDAETRERLFQPFVQADGSSSREHGGTGLGLAICRELVELMGGSLGVTSTPGSGSTFWFEVTLAKPAHGAIGEFEYDERLTGVRVLAVDDNATNRDLLKIQLSAAGMVCETAADGATALEMLRRALESGPFAIAVLDHRMPSMDGWQLAARIRADDKLRRTRVIMLGSITRTLDADEMHALGIMGYCTKPVWRKQLLETLRTALDTPLGGIAREVALPAERRAPRGATILLVEDSPFNAEVAGEILRAGGYAFDLAIDGISALEAFAKRTYDLVLMDCQLPGMNGFETTRRVRALEREGRRLSPAGKAIPIIALTASVTAEDVERCIAAGMNDHLAKPIDARRFLATIARQLGEAANGIRSVVNLVRALERLRGDRSLLDRISRQFVEAAPAVRRQLRAALEARDAKALAFAAHRLRGQASTFDADACVAALSALEAHLARERWEDASRALDVVESELSALVAALQAV